MTYPTIRTAMEAADREAMSLIALREEIVQRVFGGRP